MIVGGPRRERRESLARWGASTPDPAMNIIMIAILSSLATARAGSCAPNVRELKFLSDENVHMQPPDLLF